MDRFATSQHLYELIDPTRTSLGTLRRFDPVQHRVPVGAVQVGEHPLRGRVGRQCSREIGRNRRVGLSRIRSRPAAIGLGSVDLGNVGTSSRAIRRSDCLDGCGRVDAEQRHAPRQHDRGRLLARQSFELVDDGGAVEVE
jgi:hypothetical protein